MKKQRLIFGVSGKREQKEDSTKPYLHGTARQLITCWQLKQSRAELCPASGGLEVGSAWPSQSSHLLRYQSSCHASAPPPLGSTLSLVHSLVPTVAVGASAIISAFQARGGKRGRKAERTFPERLTQQCPPSSGWPLSLAMVLIPDHKEIVIYLQQIEK